MNQGGEPAHDDYGLPRVDIEIPDDARELDRDVQAYHRELRALRRMERSKRWRAPLRKSGMLVPLIAGCLVLAMIGGMVLTMFSANPNFAGTAGQGAPAAGQASGVTGSSSAKPGGTAGQAGQSTSPGASAPVSASGAASILPAGTIAAAGGSPVHLRGLLKVAIAIIPSGCQCAKVISRLLARAKPARISVYLVGLRGSKVSELRSLAPPSLAGTAVLAIDAHNTLASVYRPSGLTVLLVDSHRHVRLAPALNTKGQIDRALRSLKH